MHVEFSHFMTKISCGLCGCFSFSIKNKKNNTGSNFFSFSLLINRALYDVVILRSLCDTSDFVPVLFEVFVYAVINCLILSHGNETLMQWYICVEPFQAGQ